MDIHNDTELFNILQNQVVYPLAEYLSKKIVVEVNKYIREHSPISTRTLRRYTTFNIAHTTNGCTATIYVDTNAMQGEEEIGAYGVFNKFMSLDFSNTYRGQTISYQLVKWLEETGTHGSLGNNLFEPIGMFSNVYAELDKLIPRWIDTFARQNRLQIQRG